MFIIILIIAFGILLIIGIIVSLYDMVFKYNTYCPICGLQFNSYKKCMDHFKLHHINNKKGSQYV